MGVVAVACVAVVSAPMIAARGGGHHRGGRPAERHQYLAGVDFTQDAAIATADAVVGRLMLARLEGALITPKDPPGASDEGAFSPFIAMVPPGFGVGRGGLQQPTGPQHAPTPEAPFAPVQSAHATSSGLVAAVSPETPETPPELPPPPVLPPEPTVVPDPPAPPVIVVVETPRVEPPTPPTPPPEARPAPVVLTQSVPALAAVAVPEPGTWVMLVLGFGAIGAAVRRRRRERPVPEDFC